MSDTSLIFSILARSNLAQVLGRQSLAVRAFTGLMSGAGRTTVGAATASTKAVGLLSAVGSGGFAGLAVGAAGVGLAIAGIGVAAAATNKEVKSAFKDLAKDAKAAVVEAAQPLVPVLKNVASQARTLLGPLKSSLSEAFTAMAPALKDLTSGLVSGLKPLINSFGPIAKSVSPLISAIGAGLKPLLAGLASTLTVVAKTAGKFAPQLEQMFQGIGTIVKALGPLLAGLIKLGAPIIGPLLGLVGQLVGALGTGLRPVMGQLGPIIGSAVSSFTPLVGAIMSVVAALAPLLPPIFQLAGSLLSALIPAFSVIVGVIAQVAAQVVGALIPAVQPLIPAITEVAGAIGQAVVAASPLLVMIGELVGWLVGLLAPALGTAIGWVAQLAAVIVGALSGAIQWLVAAAPGAWKSLTSSLSSAVAWMGRTWDQAVAYVASIPGRVMGALGGLGSLLLSAGRDLVLGLVNGIKNAAGAVVDAAKGVVSGAINAAKSLLGIASPSKVFEWIGSMTTKGLIKGLTGELSAVKAAAKKMSGTVIKAWETGRITRSRASTLLTVIARDNARLKSLSTERASIVTRLADARKLAESVTSSARGTAELASMDFGGRSASAGGIQARLAAKLSRIQRFASVVKQLAARGLHKSVLRQVIEAGPDEGLELGMALLSADAGMMASINSAQSAIDSSSTSLGRFTADVLYDSGRQAGAGFLSGLMAQQRSIEAGMDKLAKALVTRVRKTLRIKSPSQVMAEAGVMSGLGFAGGVLSTLTRVGTAGERLAGAMVLPARRGAPVTSPSPAGGRAGGGGEVVVRLVAEGADTELLRLLRKIVRVEGRGSAQTAFGKG